MLQTKLSHYRAVRNDALLRERQEAVQVRDAKRRRITPAGVSVPVVYRPEQICVGKLISHSAGAAKVFYSFPVCIYAFCIGDYYCMGTVAL